MRSRDDLGLRLRLWTQVLPKTGGGDLGGRGGRGRTTNPPASIASGTTAGTTNAHRVGWRPRGVYGRGLVRILSTISEILRRRVPGIGYGDGYGYANGNGYENGFGYENGCGCCNGHGFDAPVVTFGFGGFGGW